MNTRERILRANDAGKLLEAIAATPYDQQDSVAEAVSDLHNRSEIDFLACCEPSPLAEDPNRSFFALQQIFCQTLPRIECSAEAAANACRAMSARAGERTPPDLIYNAFSNWNRQRPARAEETLVLIRSDVDAYARLVKPVLLAGATNDAAKYVEEAFTFSDHPQPNVRLDAVFALGHIVPTDDETLVMRAINRFDDLIENPDSEEDTAIAVDAALHLLQRGGVHIVHAVEPLLEKACRSRTPETRRALAYGLLTRRQLYTEAMTDASLAALQRVNKQNIHTMNAIDSMLYQWDLDGDRQRVLVFITNILTNDDDAPTIDALNDFTYKLGNERGCVLGWYAVSLLLTGDHRLCMAADRLLPYNQIRDGLDINLAPFSLTSPWILFLARKILGYCLMKKEATAALLPSCLRAIPEEKRPELDELVLHYFLINYISAIDWLEVAVSPTDRALQSVERLSRSLASYVHELERAGLCPAFAPSDRERQIQGYRMADYWRSVYKKAEDASILSVLADKSTILYGTTSIAYIYRDGTSDPERQEIAMTSHKHTAELPRMQVIDPVGLHHAIYRFRTEAPPT